MSRFLLDDFRTTTAWRAIAPGATQLQLKRDRAALRLDYALGNNAFVIARRALDLSLPEDYAFELLTRGVGAQPIVEFKLIDTALGNVWRLREEQFVLHPEWTPWRITAREIAYAWGARRARRLAHCDALEIAIVGSGAGSLWLQALHLVDETYRDTPQVSASSAQPAHSADQILRDDARSWRSTPEAAPWLTLDFGRERAFSALHFAWDPAFPPRAFALDIAASDGRWHCVHNTSGTPALGSTVLLPDTRAYGLRLRIDADAQGCGLRHLAFEPWYYAPTLHDGVTALALAAPLGHFPKPLREQQSYWTVITAAAGAGIALINTEGLIEVAYGEFALEAFVRVGTHFYTWADVTLTAALCDDCLPLPSVCWQCAAFELEIAPAMIGDGAEAVLDIAYRLTNRSPQPAAVTLYLVVRPYLVTPAWQIWQGRGGLARLHSIDGDTAQVRINNKHTLHLPTPADGFGAVAFASGDIVALLRDALLPAAPSVTDDDGLASAALVFTRPLPAGSSAVVYCRVPARVAAPLHARSAQRDPQTQAAAEWRAALGPCPITLAPEVDGPLRTLRTAAAHILANRAGPRLQPGPRRYTRAYLRDAVGMGTALARLGLVQPLKDFLDWYRAFQRHDGELPDCVDDQGAEWLPEFDAYGEYIHGVAEAQRLAPDDNFLARQWPHVQAALAHFEGLRAQRLGADYRSGPHAARYGLLPQSMSHEGYMAQPVHAYWDDFWALRGLHDGAWLALQMQAEDEAQRLTALAATFEHDLHTSLALTMQTHAIDFLPGSVELGDFDATAIAVALTVADDGAGLPRAALDATFDRYLTLRAARISNNDWSNYSAYEVRIVGALIRLGRRQDAIEVLNGLLADCRPAAWRQWPEISWREVDTPAFLGDLPHSWIGAEYILALLSAFAYERRADASLVLAAGVASAWLDAAAGVTVHQLATHYGHLSYHLFRPQPGRVEMHIDAGLTLPSGGLVLQPPLPAALRAVTLNGQPHADFEANHCRCHVLPAHLIFFVEQASND